MKAKALAVLEEQYMTFEAAVLEDEKKAWEAKKQREKNSKKKAVSTKEEEELEFEETLDEALSAEKEGLLMTATHIKGLLSVAIDQDNALAEKVCLAHKSYTRLLRFCIKKMMPHAFRVKAPLGVKAPEAAIVAGPDEIFMGHIVDYYNADDLEEVEKEIEATKEYLRKQEEAEAECKRKEQEKAERARQAREKALEQLATDPEYLALTDEEEKKKKLNALAQKIRYDLDRKAEAAERAKKKKEAEKKKTAKETKQSESKETETAVTEDSDGEVKVETDSHEEKDTEIANPASEQKEDANDEYFMREALATFDMKKAQMSLFDFLQ